MKISARYKVIGKRKRAILELPYKPVLRRFEDALCANGGTRLSGSVDRDTGRFKIEYKTSLEKNEVYENYCMLAQVKKTPDGYSKIEYAFVYDRLMSVYTAILSIICFLVPLGAAAVVYFNFMLRSPIHLLLYVPLLLISAFGLFSLFIYREKMAVVKPMVKEFEKLMADIFSE